MFRCGRPARRRTQFQTLRQAIARPAPRIQCAPGSGPADGPRPRCRRRAGSPIRRAGRAGPRPASRQDPRPAGSDDLLRITHQGRLFAKMLAHIDLSTPPSLTSTPSTIEHAGRRTRGGHDRLPHPWYISSWAETCPGNNTSGARSFRSDPAQLNRAAHRAHRGCPRRAPNEEPYLADHPRPHQRPAQGHRRHPSRRADRLLTYRPRSPTRPPTQTALPHSYLGTERIIDGTSTQARPNDQRDHT
jgi:hypothetical protein